MANENKVWPAALLIAAVLILGLFWSTIAISNTVKDNSQAKIDLSNVATKTDLSNVESGLANEISKIESSLNQSVESDRLDEAVDHILSTEDEKSIVQSLADEYLEDKEFKKELVEFLNGEEQNVESYKDIESIQIKDSDLSYKDSKNKATVEYELVVKYFNDGDDEEEDVEKAKLLVTLDLDNLDEDEDFDDTETEVSEFELVKFY